MVIIIILLIAFAIFAVFKQVGDGVRESANDRAERAAAYKAAYKMEVQKRKDDFLLKFDELKQKYGDCSFDVDLGKYQEYNMCKHILVFESSEILYVANEYIPFGKIIGFELKDNQTTITRTTSPEYNTSTNTGSMLGRAVVGGILTGGIGAAVGAATAKKTTTVVKEGRTETITKHNYRINLNVDDLSNPIRVIDFGCNVDKAEQVSNVLNVIIYRTQGDILNP